MQPSILLLVIVADGVDVKIMSVVPVVKLKMVLESMHVILPETITLVMDYQ